MWYLSGATYSNVPWLLPWASWSVIFQLFALRKFVSRATSSLELTFEPPLEFELGAVVADVPGRVVG
jgi:hypothetical protein